MNRKFVVRSDSYGECVYLRMFGRGRYGSKFGLVRSPAEATAFSSRLEASTKAGWAGNVIMRAFNAVELDAIPAATTLINPAHPPARGAYSGALLLHRHSL
jgi:hypothetical protein